MTRAIEAHATLIFWILACAVSWGAMLAVAGPDAFPLEPGQAATVGAAALLGPSVAGLSMTFALGRGEALRALGRRLVRWRVGLSSYAAALVIAPGVDALAVSALALHEPTIRPALLVTAEPGALVAQGVAAGLVVALFEELGWTGFAVPRLRRRRGAMATGVIVGAVWGLWHWPMFWQPESFTTAAGFILLLAKLFAWLPAYRVLLVWMHDRTESLLLCVLMHASLVTSLTTVEPSLGDHDLLVFIALRASLLWTLAFLIVLLGRRRGGSSASPVA